MHLIYNKVRKLVNILTSSEYYVSEFSENFKAMLIEKDMLSAKYYCYYFVVDDILCHRHY